MSVLKIYDNLLSLGSTLADGTAEQEFLDFVKNFHSSLTAVEEAQRLPKELNNAPKKNDETQLSHEQKTRIGGEGERDPMEFRQDETESQLTIRRTRKSVRVNVAKLRIEINSSGLVRAKGSRINRDAKRKYNNINRELNSNDSNIAQTNYPFDVEKIIMHCVRKDIIYYRVKWEGYPKKYNTWEEESSFDKGNVILKEFKLRHNL